MHVLTVWPGTDGQPVGLSGFMRREGRRGRLPSRTPTALQVSPYDNCAPIRDMCVPIMLDCPYCGSTLQVAGISRHTRSSRQPVAGGQWG